MKKTLEKNVIVKKETKVYNEKTPLAVRLMNFQDEDIEIIKSKKAYGYNYAPLDVILPLIKPYLKKHGIGYYHNTFIKPHEENGIISDKQHLKTTFFNTDNVDDKIECDTMINEKVALSKMNEFMVIGSAITYFRRYHIVTVLGLTTDEDSDAGGAQPKNNEKAVDSKGESKIIEKQGRSVESATTENTVDYVAIFTNATKSKNETQVNKMLDMYSKNMSAIMLKTVKEILVKAYK